jgi:arginine exporter protein ArgO
VADTIFGAVAAFGLTFIADFLVRHENYMRLGGGVLLLVLGMVGLLKRHEVMAPAPPSVRGAAGDSVSAFILTITNPMTMLTFSPVFLAVGAVVEANDAAAAWTLILGVFAGSCIWWVILCALAELFRRKINATRIRFSVKVPVLSTASTVAAPIDSTAGIRRVKTPAREMRQAPIARKTVSTTGNSSGRMPMASVTPASTPPSQSVRATA